MSTGWKFKKAAGALVLCVAVLCLGIASADARTRPRRPTRKRRSPRRLPPLPSGPTGPVHQIPLDSIAPVPPQVSYQNEQLTIVAPNSTLGDILRAVRKQTGAEIEIPSAPERVVTHLGPGPARTVMAELLNGSRFNYVLLGSPANDALLTRVVLVAKTGPENVDSTRVARRWRNNSNRDCSSESGSRSRNAAPDANDAEAAADDSTDDDAGPGGSRGGTATGRPQNSLA